VARIVNITDKLTSGKPEIQIGDKKFAVNNSVSTVLQFEELITVKSQKGMIASMELALGKEACEELKIEDYSMDNFQVLVIAVIAAMQGETYEATAERFQQAFKSGV